VNGLAAYSFLSAAGL